MRNILLKFKLQQGQTLIETLAALFILVMGLSSAVGLAVYAFGSSTEVAKEIIATGLARQGLEAVKNMRDTNWLSQGSPNNTCYNFTNPTAFNANCYLSWLGTSTSSPPFFCLDPSSNGTGCSGNLTATSYSLIIRSSNANTSSLWSLQNESATPDYALSFNPTNSLGTGFYTSNGTTACGGTVISDYCRKIIITKNSSASPYNQNTGPLVEVQSQVWWIDKKCPRSSNWPGLGKCSVELDTYLTNWKNY